MNTTIAASGAVFEQKRTQLGTLGLDAIAIHYCSVCCRTLINCYFDVCVNWKGVVELMD